MIATRPIFFSPARAAVIFAALLSGLLLLTWWVYRPGLSGGFLFDDFVNLNALGAMGPVHDWSSLLRYLTSGNADPTGRPLTLLTFLLDAQDWPALPFSFKRTSLILHLLNGALLACLLRRLGRLLPGFPLDHGTQPTRSHDALRVDTAALLGAAFWLLHPLFVSTTLYIVQREAMLSATCSLLGLLLWLSGRERLRRGSWRVGTCLLVLGGGGFSLLGMLAKANGLLLPLYILLIEYLLLRTRQPVLADSPAGPAATLAYRRVLLWCVWLPAALIVGYLVQQGWHGLIHGLGSLRPWTLGQRLLTEPRILLDYLRLLWLPHPFTSGLFNDQIQVSTSLWSPITTLPALFGVTGLLGAAWSLRRRRPAATLAILFFFAGQLMESTTIALELYYEHRNYVPAMLMFWPLALWLCGVPQARNMRVLEHVQPYSHLRVRTLANLSALKLLMTTLLLAGMGWMTHANAELWGDTRDQMRMWARLNPDSPRAQVSAAQEDMSNGQPQRATARLLPLLQKQPDQAQVALNLLGARCMMGSISEDDLGKAETAMGTTHDPGGLLVSWSERAIGIAKSGSCQGFDLSMLQHLLDHGMTNPYFSAGRRQDILHIRGNIALAEQHGDLALQDFNAALDLDIRISAALDQAAELGAAGYPQLGVQHLAHYDSVRADEAPPGMGMPLIHAWVLQRQHYWPRELARLRATLNEDASHQTSHP
jgi:tetratricopeptide (TPR) repeat protein